MSILITSSLSLLNLLTIFLSLTIIFIANNAVSMNKIANWSSDTRNCESAKVLLSFIHKSKSQTNEAREHSALILSWMELRQNLITKAYNNNQTTKNQPTSSTNTSTTNNISNESKLNSQEETSSQSDSDQSRVRRGSSNFTLSPRESLVGTDEFSSIMDSKGNFFMYQLTNNSINLLFFRCFLLFFTSRALKTRSHTRIWYD